MEDTCNREGELRFDFPDDLIRQKLDKKGITKPQGMVLADFVIETETEIILLEVKDPSCSVATKERKRAELENLRGNTLIAEKLTPKARDSYTYLHLMKRDEKPIIYVVLLGLDSYPQLNTKEFLLRFKEKLLNNIRREADKPWERKHIYDCLVCSIGTWNENFSDWKVTRILNHDGIS
jgi:hypothetical protein